MKSTNNEIGGSHYKDCKFQPIELIKLYRMNFFQGNIVKYVTRFRKKNGREDLRKAIHYAQLGMELAPENTAIYNGSYWSVLYEYASDNELPELTVFILMLTLKQHWKPLIKALTILENREYGIEGKVTISSSKSTSIMERIKVCWKVLSAYTFVFCSAGKMPNYKKNICCIEQNTYDEFNAVVSSFVGSNFKGYAGEKNDCEKSPGKV